MPRGYIKRNNVWTQLKKMYVKRNGVWTNLATAYVKRNGLWVKIFTPAGPSLNSSPIITPRLGGKLYDIYDSTTGSWDNATSFTRTWGRSDNLGGPFTDIPGQTSVAYTTRDADDNKYITVTVRATDADGLFAEAAAVPVKIVKYIPVSLAAYNITGSPTVGSILTASETLGITWKLTTDRSGDTYPDEYFYEWKWADTEQEAYNNSDNNTYTVTEEDLGHTISVRVTGTNSGGSTTSAWSAPTAAITTQYFFSFGKSLFVGSNGYIGLDSGGFTAGAMGSGRNLSIHSIDLQQWYLAEYSTTTFYTLYFRSYLFNTISSPSSLNALDYQIKFYNDSSIPYCDVFIVRRGSNVGSAVRDSGYYSNGNLGFSGILGPYFLGTGSSMRIFFDGRAATTTAIGWTPIPDNVWDLIRDDRPNGLDDSFTQVITAPNQAAPVPVNISLPTLTTNTGEFAAGRTITLNVGSWTSANSYDYEIHVSTNTPVPENSTTTKTLINTNQYVITNSDASNPSFYFRGKVTAYANSNKTGNSTVAWTVTSPRSFINASTTISVSSPTSNGFTISGTATPVENSFAFVTISPIRIYNSSFILIATITTGLPTVNPNNGTWSYIWTGGSPNTTYYAEAVARAIDSAGTSFGSVSGAITTTLALVTPTSLSATTTDRTKIRITFAGGSATDYMLYWLTNSAGAPNSAFTGFDFTTTSSPFDWTTMNRGTTYYFFVRSRTGTTGNFTYSPSWFPSSAPGVIAKAPLYAPGTPTGLTGSVISSSRIDISWTAPTTGVNGPDLASGYDVFYSTSSSNPGAFTTPTTTTTSTSLSVTGLVASTTYFFWVRASNADNTGSSAGSWTASISRTTSAPPAVIPTITMGANTLVTQTSGRINWTSTNQASFSSNGVFSGTGTTATFVAASGLTASTTYTGTVTVTSSTGNTASANYSLRTSNPVAPPAPAMTSGPFISWGSGNNFTLSATASNATNIEFQVQYANTSGGTVQNTVTYFMGASLGSRTTGAQQYPWARTRARANNTTTGLSSSFTAFTAWA